MTFWGPFVLHSPLVNVDPTGHRDSEYSEDEWVIPRLLSQYAGEWGSGWTAEDTEAVLAGGTLLIGAAALPTLMSATVAVVETVGLEYAAFRVLKASAEEFGESQMTGRPFDPVNVALDAATEVGDELWTAARYGSSSRGSGNAGKTNRLKLRPDENAVGPHTTFRRDARTGEINHYETYQPDPHHPSGFAKELRVDMTGSRHYNKVTGEYVEPPHIHSRSIPGGVARAEPWRWTLRR